MSLVDSRKSIDTIGWISVPASSRRLDWRVAGLAQNPVADPITPSPLDLPACTCHTRTTLCAGHCKTEQYLDDGRLEYY